VAHARQRHHARAQLPRCGRHCVGRHHHVALAHDEGAGHAQRGEPLEHPLVKHVVDHAGEGQREGARLARAAHRQLARGQRVVDQKAGCREDAVAVGDDVGLAALGDGVR
jgi:hypothetical protein